MPVTTSPPDDYDRRRERSAERQAEQSRLGREIGDLPKVKNSKRRAKCRENFRLFCETYFPRAFPLAWSADHLLVLERIEQAVLKGGLFAVAMPRGNGKTTLCERAVIWAVIYGHHRYAMLVCADEKKGKTGLDKIKIELENNPLLLADFPEVGFPIKKLERIANRTKGQTHQGEPTRMEWTGERIVLPTITGSVSTGAVIGAGGITSAVRGAAYQLVDGTVTRPSLVMIDDPQTRESANSQMQCHTREQIVSADVLGMAGPGEKIAALMPCTVIKKGDMADRLLDRMLHPDWQGVRTKLLIKFPDRMDLWEQYREIRAESLRADGDGKEATKFYRKHRKQMDAGAVIAWKQRRRDDELSALQHAMNLYFRDQEAFFSEYQNEPLEQEIDGWQMLTADEVAAKSNNIPRGRLPHGSTHLTAYIDVQEKILWYMVVAWDDRFSGNIVQYGAWPDQGRVYFTLNDVRLTMADVLKGGREARIYAALTALTEDLLGKEWPGDDGTFTHVERCLIDTQWGESTEVIYQFCRQSKYAARVMPSHGKGWTASMRPMHEEKKQRGERRGLNWKIPKPTGKRMVKHMLIDTNWWKSFVHERLAVPIGDPGCIALHQGSVTQHRMLAEQLTAEYAVPTEGRGRKLLEWKERPERPDNHLFDCLVGNAVAASMLGVELKTLEGFTEDKKPKKQKIRLSDLQNRRDM